MTTTAPARRPPSPPRPSRRHPSRPDHDPRRAAGRTRARGLPRILAAACALAAAPGLVGAGTAPDAPLDDACWELTFEDEFDALALRDESGGGGDPDGRWRTRYIWERDTIINDELQYYVDPAEHGLSPFRIEDGALVVSARETPPGIAASVAGQPYVSGVLTTERSFAQRHGRFEARARVPRGRGLWSALWLLPSFERWPEGVAVLPEIDVMEHLGHAPETYHTTLHTNQSGPLTSHGSEHDTGVDLTAGFHLYSVVWTPETVSWYLDREPVFSHPTPADFTRPVHFLINLAVGGSWPGAPDETTAFPAEYRVDAVRAWRDAGTC